MYLNSIHIRYVIYISNIVLNISQQKREEDDERKMV